MKKFMLILISALVFLCGECVFAEDSLVKVGLFYSSSARSEYSLSSDDKLYIASDGNELFSLDVSEISVQMGIFEEWDAPLYETGSADRGDECVKLYSTDGNLLYVSENKLEVFSYGGRVKITAVATKEYRGGMIFSLADDGKINCINYVDTEEYLYSVISREMSPTWPVEALKAQAVCARNYAVRNKNKHKAYGFDLCDSVCCQAYGGTSAEAEGSFAPVDETAGMLLYYEDEIAQVFYSSSMGPTTEDVKYVWGSEFPYLTSVDNPYEDYENVYNGKWEKTLTKQRATEIMESKGYEVGNVTEIKVLENSPSGRVIKLLVKGDKGEKIFERESCRIVFSEVTLSQLYTISGGGGGKLPKAYVLGADPRRQDVLRDNGELFGKTVLTDRGEISLGESFSAIGAEGIKKFLMESSGTADAYTFSGFGWGHGIGMSQYGAKGMAEAGFSFEEILTHYFTGTEIRHSGL